MCQPEKRRKSFRVKKFCVLLLFATYVQSSSQQQHQREKERAPQQQLNQCSMSLFSVVLNTWVALV
jgi:hypothetical protein